MKKLMNHINLILVVISLIYIAVVQPDWQTSVGVIALNLFHYVQKFLSMYFKATKKIEKEPTELDTVLEDIRLEDAKMRLEKLKRRETKTVGMSAPSHANLGF